jgi:hypothetical protein
MRTAFLLSQQKSHALFRKFFEHASEPSLQSLSSDLLQISAIAVSAEAPGTLPVPESCSEKPDSHCTSRSLHLAIHALASHCLLLQCLTFSAESTLHDRASKDRRLAPPESIQNRTACRSPTVARPLPHNIAASTPRLRGVSRDRGDE